jgi:hypothetical protein
MLAQLRHEPEWVALKLRGEKQVGVVETHPETRSGKQRVERARKGERPLARAKVAECAGERSSYWQIRETMSGGEFSQPTGLARAIRPDGKDEPFTGLIRLAKKTAYVGCGIVGHG